MHFYLISWFTLKEAQLSWNQTFQSITANIWNINSTLVGKYSLISDMTAQITFDVFFLTLRLSFLQMLFSNELLKWDKFIKYGLDVTAVLQSVLSSSAMNLKYTKNTQGQNWGQNWISNASKALLANVLQTKAYALIRLILLKMLTQTFVFDHAGEMGWSWQCL